jgi:transcriptional regulator with XRE-family HTH domain
MSGPSFDGRMAGDLGPLDALSAVALLELGRVVRSLRIDRRISQRTMAARCGLSQSTISRLESGKAPGLRIGWLARIIAGLDRPPEWPGERPWHVASDPPWAIKIQRFARYGALAKRLAELEATPPKRPHPSRRLRVAEGGPRCAGPASGRRRPRSG